MCSPGWTAGVNGATAEAPASVSPHRHTDREPVHVGPDTFREDRQCRRETDHRRRWRVWQRYMDGDRFVFLDETGATTSMTRRYGWGERGDRLVDAVPYGPWTTPTFVAGLRARGIIAPFVLDGPMTGEAFRAYVEQVLAPELEPGDAVVMDNL